MLRLIVCLVSLAMTAPAIAQEREHDTPSGQPVPRFVSLKFDVANGRSGPSQAHPIAWRYLRSGLPMEIIAETQDWRRVRDPEGEVTWMHRTILSGRRTVLTTRETELLARAEDDSPVEAIAEAGVVLSLERCRSGWCRVEGQGYRGWIDAGAVWGLYMEERGGENAADAHNIPNLSATLARDTALR